LPELGFDLEPLIAGSIVLGLHYSCYIAEVFRSALLAIDRGQQEASRALGLRRFLVYRLVIFPQMLPLLVPDVGNAIIALVKDTPILSAISVMEMLAKMKEIGADTFRYVEPMTICGIIYLIISYVLAIIIKIIRSQFSWIRATR
jgi:polar amino acid transport system permease protein